jgi:hypothetical protein
MHTMQLGSHTTPQARLRQRQSEKLGQLLFSLSPGSACAQLLARRASTFE